MNLNIHIEGNAHTYTVDAQNDRGEIYRIHVTDDWGELEYFEVVEAWAGTREMKVETIPIEGKTLQRVMAEYVIPDLT